MHKNHTLNSIMPTVSEAAQSTTLSSSFVLRIYSILFKDWLKEYLLENSTNENIHDFNSLVRAMIKAEYLREKAILKQFLACPENFADNFKHRCLQRSQDNTNCINFQLLANSPTNKLFTALAVLLFPEDPLAVLIPNVKKCYSVVIPENINLSDGIEDSLFNPANRRVNLKKKLLAYTPPLVEVERKSIAADALGHCVISGSYLFDVRSILSLTTLHFQKNFCNSLSNRFPELAWALYQHNEDLRSLKEKIDYLNRPKNPREAMQSLILALKAGGTAVTGSNSASIGAVRAYLGFVEYIKLLPEEVQKSLQEINDNQGHNLGTVLNHFRAGDCVETAANHLLQIISYNPKHEILDKTPANNSMVTLKKRKEFIEELQSFSTKKEFISFDEFLPVNLLEEQVTSLPLEDFEFCLLLILSLPSQCAEKICQQFHDKYDLVKGLLNAVRARIFDNKSDKKLIIFTIITKLLRAQKSLGEVLNSEEISISADFLAHILTIFPEEVRVLLESSSVDVIFKHFITQFDHLELFSALLPKGKRLSLIRNSLYELLNAGTFAAAIRTCELSEKEWANFLQEPRRDVSYYSNTITIWEHTTKKGELFCDLLKGLPENLRWHFIVANDYDVFPSSLLWNADKILAMLELLPEEQRKEAIKKLIADHKTPLLARRFDSTRLFALLLPYLDKSECLELAQENDSYLRYPFWQFMVLDVECLNLFLQKYPIEERWGIVQKLNGNYDNILHYYSQLRRRSCLPDIIALLPEADKLAALMLKSETKNLAWTCAADNPEVIRLVFSMPEAKLNDWVDFLEARTLKTVWQIICEKPEALEALLGAIPKKEDRLQFLLSPNGNTTFSRLFSMNITPKILAVIVNALTNPGELQQEYINGLLNAKDSRGRNLFHILAKNSEALSLLQPYCSAALLLTVDSDGLFTPIDILHNENRSSLVGLLKNLSPEDQLVVFNSPLAKSLIKSIVQDAELTDSYCKVRPFWASNTAWFNAELVKEAWHHPKSFAVLLAQVPKEERLLFLDSIWKFLVPVVAREMNGSEKVPGEQQQAHYLALLSAIVTSLKDSDDDEGTRNAIRRFMLKEDMNGNLLDKLIFYPECIALLKPYFTADDLNISNSNHLTTFHRAVKCPQTLCIFLQDLSQEEQLNLMKNYSSGSTVLTTSISYRKSLQLLINLIPKNQRLEFFKAHSGSTTIWQSASLKPKAFALTIDCLPERERICALEQGRIQGLDLIDSWNFHKASDCESFLHLLSSVHPDDISRIWQDVFRRKYSFQLMLLEIFLRSKIGDFAIKSQCSSRHIKLINALEKEPEQERLQILGATVRLLIRNDKAKDSSVRKTYMYQYIDSFNALPEISQATKILCIALAFTIVGILPAALIWSASKYSLFKRREKIFDTTQALNDKVFPSAPVR